MQDIERKGGERSFRDDTYGLYLDLGRNVKSEFVKAIGVYTKIYIFYWMQITSQF